MPVIESPIGYMLKDRACGWPFGDDGILNPAGNVMSHAHDCPLHPGCYVVSLAIDAFMEHCHEGICCILHIYIAAY